MNTSMAKPSHNSSTMLNHSTVEALNRSMINIQDSVAEEIVKLGHQFQGAKLLPAKARRRKSNVHHQ